MLTSDENASFMPSWSWSTCVTFRVSPHPTVPDLVAMPLFGPTAGNRLPSGENSSAVTVQHGSCRSVLCFTFPVVVRDLIPRPCPEAPRMRLPAIHLPSSEERHREILHGPDSSSSAIRRLHVPTQTAPLAVFAVRRRQPSCSRATRARRRCTGKGIRTSGAPFRLAHIPITRNRTIVVPCRNGSLKRRDLSHSWMPSRASIAGSIEPLQGLISLPLPRSHSTHRTRRSRIEEFRSSAPPPGSCHRAIGRDWTTCRPLMKRTPSLPTRLSLVGPAKRHRHDDRRGSVSVETKSIEGDLLVGMAGSSKSVTKSQRCVD